MDLCVCEELNMEVCRSILDAPRIYKFNSAIRGENKERKKSRKMEGAIENPDLINYKFSLAVIQK
jgi:hypothetical protein